MMKTTEILVFISTLVVLFSATTASGKGQLESDCDADTDCVQPYICLRQQCAKNYCKSNLFDLEHATCTPKLDGYDAQCNDGYEYMDGKCEPIQSSATGFEGNTCTTSRDCLTSLECKNDQCVDPCRYHRDKPHVDCAGVYHEAKFTCHPGYIAASYLKSFCYRIPQEACKSDDDCSSAQTCDFFGDCVDPCLNPPAVFVNGVCAVEDHSIKIACHDGYEAIPCSFRCEKIIANDAGVEGAQCSASTDCMSSLACSKGQCADPCKELPTEKQSSCETVNHIVRRIGQCG